MDSINFFRKRKIKRNGYALTQSLMVLLLLSQCCLCISLFLKQQGHMKKVLERNQEEVVVLTQANSFIQDILWERHCLPDQKTFSKKIEFDDKTALFEDKGKYIHVDLKSNFKTLTMRVFYEETGIQKIEYQ